MEDLPSYEDRHGIHRHGIARRLARDGRNTRLVARLMTEAAEKKYHFDSDVPEVDYSAVPARRGASSPLNSDETRDIHTMLERFFGPHPDGYAPDLPGTIVGVVLRACPFSNVAFQP